MSPIGQDRIFSISANLMTTTLPINSAIDDLQALAGQDITVQGVPCFEFEGTAIDHFPKVERREPDKQTPSTRRASG